MREPRFDQARRQARLHPKAVRSTISTRARTRYTCTAAHPERRRVREPIPERAQRRRPRPLPQQKRLRYRRQQRHRSRARSPHPQSPRRLRPSQRLYLQRLRRWQLRSRHPPVRPKLHQSRRRHLRPRFTPWLRKPRLRPQRKLPMQQRSAWNRPPIRFQCHQRDHHQRRSRAPHLRFRWNREHQRWLFRPWQNLLTHQKSAWNPPRSRFQGRRRIHRRRPSRAAHLRFPWNREHQR